MQHLTQNYAKYVAHQEERGTFFGNIVNAARLLAKRRTLLKMLGVACCVSNFAWWI